MLPDISTAKPASNPLTLAAAKPVSDASLMSGGPGQAPTLLIPKADADLARLGAMDRDRSWRVRWPRTVRNRKNWDFFHMNQDWSQKIDGQSRIFLPDLPIAVAQTAATIENQLVNFENWFSIEKCGGLSVFDPDTLRKLVRHLLDRLYKPGNEVDTALKFTSFLAQSLIVGLIESEVCWKVYGVDSERAVYLLESQNDDAGMAAEDTAEWDNPEGFQPERTYERLTKKIQKAFIRSFRLGVDLIPFEDSFPDPSPLNRYHIHEVTRHISELRNNPDYDPDVVSRLANQISNLDSERDKARRSGLVYSVQLAKDPGQVRVQEYWGDLVDYGSGKVLYRNCFFTLCNGKLLRPPTPNPFWHGYRPILRTALLETPLSPVHKALVDHSVPSAEAENELASLMVDGGIASVWGTRQARPDLLADPTSISKGIPPSFTAVLKRGAPQGAKFLERVDEGSVTPDYGMQMLQRMGRAREVGMATPSFPNANTPRQAPATEAVYASEASDNLFENLATHLEVNIIEPFLQLSWLTTWQGLDDFSAPELVEILGPERAALLTALDPEERFYLFSNGIKFNVRGLRNLMQQINEFRKITTVVQMMGTNPFLQQALMQRFNPARMVEDAIRAVNVDPTKWEWRVSEEAERLHMQQVLMTPAKPGVGPGPADQASPYAPPGVTPSVGESNVEGEFAPPNPTGFQGTNV